MRIVHQDGGQEDRQVTITVRGGISYCQGDKSYDCTISATQAWQQTPLLLQSGDRFTISSIGGTWTVDRDHFPFVGPDGYSPEIDQQICCHDQCKTDFSQPYAKLLARIGNGPHFVAGSGGTFTADRAGFLAFRINDEAACQENDAGSVTMRLERR